MYPRWLWPAFALPGVVWLLILFLLPFYAVIGVAFGSVDPILQTPIPAWNPLDWNVGWVDHAAASSRRAATTGTSSCARSEYVAISLARLHPDRLSGRLLHLPPRRRAPRACCWSLLILPFWVSYLMRMLAWVNLLAPDGYVNAVPDLDAHQRPALPPGLAQPARQLLAASSRSSSALVYGYIPYFILPLLASLDRIDRSTAGGGARPRRQPLPRLLARDAAAVEDRPAGRRGADRAADVRRLLHARTSSPARPTTR